MKNKIIPEREREFCCFFNKIRRETLAKHVFFLLFNHKPNQQAKRIERALECYGKMKEKTFDIGCRNQSIMIDRIASLLSIKIINDEILRESLWIYAQIES